MLTAIRQAFEGVFGILKKPILSVVIAVFVHALMLSSLAFAETREVFITPDILVSEYGEKQDIERGLMFVPENRARPNSRTISFHFFRAPALSPKKGAAPIFYLHGGPGAEQNFKINKNFQHLKKLRHKHDVVYLSQRGYEGAPGVNPDFEFRYLKYLPFKKAGSIDREGELLASAYRAAGEAWRERGVDLTGYDILNIVDDVYDLRETLGYEKISLRGCSFGSQWSTSYMKLHPETVDRALLSGVEPLDYTYDSAKWLWASMSRVASAAEKDPELARYIPEGGIMGALKTVIQRLETEPVTVSIQNGQGKEIDIVLGPDDLRNGAVRNFRSIGRGTALADLAAWPKFVLEMYNDDFRFLALMAAEGRREMVSDSLITYLIDNSIGISDERDRQLLSEEERRWIDPNWYYRSTRKIPNSNLVDQSFRDDWRIDVPTLLVTGDYDWYTPVENAEHMERFLDNGHLIIVEGGTHCPIMKSDQLTPQRPKVVDQIREFFSIDTDEQSLSKYFSRLPKRVALDAIDFDTPKSQSLYEERKSRSRN
ncbi:MAG: alpha/beta fold hydrolase [Pseudomonadota bacterium]